MLRACVWFLFTSRRHPGWRACLREARAVARLDAASLRAWQEDALRAHLRWASVKVPWHRARAAGAEALSGFPVLTRGDVRAHAEALRGAPDGVPMASGGSTGEPVTVYHDAGARRWCAATGAFLHETRGLRPWARGATVWGVDAVAGARGWRERLLADPTLDAFDLTDESMARFAAALERRPPEVLRGYASALELFAAFLLRAGRWRVRPRAVVSTAEALGGPQREILERAFACRVYDGYGSRECAYLAWECPEGGLHVAGHGRVLEIVDGDGAPCPPGVPGRVLVTDFRNRGFGLIRYENGDVASWAEDRHRCACGLAFPRLERVHGRTSDFITAPSGERIHGEWFTHLFYGQPRVARFQVRQPSRERLEVLTVGAATETELAMILEQIRARMGPRTEVAWRRVDDIPLTPAGKHRFTVSEVPFR